MIGRLMLVFAVTGFLAGCGKPETPVSEPAAGSLLIRGAEIIDGSGRDAYVADLRISGGLISAIGELESRAGEDSLDATGLVLSPGFIDTHSHADSDIFEHPDALAAVSQGITTVIVGQDGGSPFPLAEFIGRLDNTGAAINFASYVGHNTVRERVMGEDFRRVATDDEVASMRELLLHEYSAGAIGLSTGLEYDPGIYSDSEEVLSLAQAIADAGGRYISHMRSEDRWLNEAVDEIIGLGRSTGMPVQISHFKLAMKSLWGSAPKVLAKLNAARVEGIDITADIYPYEYWQSNMMVLLPERDPTDLDAVAFALRELAPPDGIWLTEFGPQPEYVGKSLTRIAELRETDPVSTYSQLAQESLAMSAETGRGEDAIIGSSMTDADIGELLAWEHSNICTDGGLVDLHPRATGSFPRVIARYVREQKLMSLETAVRKMTGLAADHMGMRDRGYLRPTLAADLVLFDADTIADRATPEHPDALSEGINAVWVNGEQIYASGKVQDARPGRFLKRAP
ncbi:MAG: D-aminoacylase [Halioglobus sp.]|nr:D-aminoacylase [Halioglobus sp.]